MTTLQVYISADCWSCQETERIIAEMRPRFPGITFELLDTQYVTMPAHVFAVPTYVLNGRVISLGNPTREKLHSQLSAAT